MSQKIFMVVFLPDNDDAQRLSELPILFPEYDKAFDMLVSVADQLQPGIEIKMPKGQAPVRIELKNGCAVELWLVTKTESAVKAHLS